MERPKRQPLICGIDEVGRGPLAGPVTAAATVLPGTVDRSVLRDSKVLSPARRNVLEELLIANGTFFGLGWVSSEDIDSMNIHNASLLAMKRAFEALLALELLPPGPIDVIVDGRFSPDIAGNPVVTQCRALVGADHIIPEVMAASILAKNARDRQMVLYAKRYSQYGFERHKGYPTAEHKAALREHGPSPIHRRTFRGVVPPGAVL